MKKNMQTNILRMLKSKIVLVASGALVLISCGTQMGGYSETDGVYYDPNKDTLPEGVVINQQGNQVGEDYNYNNDSTYNYDSTYVQDVRSRNWQQNSKYWDGNPQDSDWGVYAGSETNYFDNWGWGSPWGWGLSWGWGSPWGWNSPFWGSRFGFGWGWGSSWGWGGWYDPFWNGYSPFYSSFYNPYWGYYGYNGYNPYWGWGSSFYAYSPMYRYQRSGANGRMYNSYQGGQLRQAPNQNGFRRTNSGTFRNNSEVFRNNSDSPRFRNPQRNNGMQNIPQRNTPTRQQPVYQTPPRNQAPPRSNDGGFRSGGFNNGGSPSSSGGGFRGGSSTGGGSRSGGFRR